MLKKYFPLTPVICLSILLKIAVMKGLYFGYHLSYSYYLALFVLIINYYIFFNQRNLYKYILVLTFLLGNTNLLQFTLSQYESILRIGNFKIAFNPTMAFVAIITYILNYSKFYEIIFRLLSTSSLSDQEYSQFKSEESIEKFKETFSSFDDEKLLKIINDNRYTHEAKIAAKSILEIKKSNSNFL